MARSKRVIHLFTSKVSPYYTIFLIKFHSYYDFSGSYKVKDIILLRVGSFWFLIKPIVSRPNFDKWINSLMRPVLMLNVKWPLVTTFFGGFWCFLTLNRPLIKKIYILKKTWKKLSLFWYKVYLNRIKIKVTMIFLNFILFVCIFILIVMGKHVQSWKSQKWSKI